MWADDHEPGDTAADSLCLRAEAAECFDLLLGDNLAGRKAHIEQRRTISAELDRNSGRASWQQVKTEVSFKATAVKRHPKTTNQTTKQLITDALERNFMPYAMSVVSRATGTWFKPSHRKLL